MKRLITIFSLMALTIAALFLTNQMISFAKSSTTASDSMITASQLYESGQYSLAAQTYQQLVDQGYSDYTLFYNLGNAYYKQGNFGLAILNYSRAEQLAPRDAQIEANLALARAQVTGNSDVVVENSLFDNVTNITQEYFTLNELAIAAAGAWILFVSLIIAYNSTRKGSAVREGVQYALVVATLVFTVSGIGLGTRLYQENAHPQGVIVASQVNVTSGPSQQNITEFTLTNGTEVELLETRDNWVQLNLPNTGVSGWVPANTIEALTS
jgi:tetratricopeptide (TPR) repeat protein